MLVVSDSSPFVALLKIGNVDALPKLYGSVIIPTEVAAELASVKRPIEVRSFIESAPAWLTVRAPTELEAIADIDKGELAAKSLARELKADILLIDETRGREAAIARNIRTLRTTAMLLDAANAGVIPEPQTRFR